MLEIDSHPADERYPCYGEHRSYLVPSPLPPEAQGGSIEAVARYVFKWPCHISPWQANKMAKDAWGTAGAAFIVPIGCEIFHIEDQYAFPAMRHDGAPYCAAHNHQWAVRTSNGCQLLKPRYIGPAEDAI